MLEYPGFDMPDPEDLLRAKTQLAELVGPFFANMACKKHGTWAVGLAKLLAEKGDLPNGPFGQDSASTLAAPHDEMQMLEMGDDSLVEHPGMSLGLGAVMSMGMVGEMDSLDADAMDAT